MKQKLHSLLLLVVLLSWSIVGAASDFDDGILKYTIISPSNLEVKCDGFTDAHKNDETVGIPETVNYDNATYSVVSISFVAFSDCSSLTSLKIPSSVTSIGGRAFSGCSSLTSLDIPSSVTSIGDWTFSGCSGLTSLKIPSSVTSIGDYAFSGCSGLTSFDIPSSVTSIGDYAFSGCSGLTSFDIPSSVTSIEGFFWGCSGLTSLKIPSSVTSIGFNAFSGCSSLTSLDIPSSVTSIGGRAFSGCSSLTSLEIPSSVTSIGSDAFSGCSSLTSLEIPSSITSIGDYTFRNFSSLTSLKIPSSVTSIGNCAFDGCSSLTSLDIPSSVTSIGYSAFNNCRGLTSLEIPSSVTSIGDNAFDGCTSLVSVVMPNNVKIIGVGVFAHCSSLKHITIPSSINFIAPFLFWGCSSLENIEIPASVECIWGGAFYQCVNLKSIICNPLKAPAFRDPKLNISGGECICEPTLASQITLVTSKGAVGYAEAPWSYFKAPEALRLTDENVTVSPGAYPIGALTYNRSNMKPGSYATFCLPFDTNLSEVSDAFENVYTANQTALYKPDGKLILLLQKIDTDASISAGQPFVAKLKDNVTDVTFSNNKLMTVDSDIMQNGTPTPLRVFDWDGTSGLLTENTDIKVSYGGALSTMTGVGSEYETFNSNGTFGPTKGGQVKAFRAYVLKEDAVTQGRVKSISLGIEGNDGTTNIETIVDSPEKNTDKMVYSIDGRLVNTTGSVVGLPSGIYIKNHQKIYVK